VGGPCLRFSKKRAPLVHIGAVSHPFLARDEKCHDFVPTPSASQDSLTTSANDLDKTLEAFDFHPMGHGSLLRAQLREFLPRMYANKQDSFWFCKNDKITGPFTLSKIREIQFAASSEGMREPVAYVCHVDESGDPPNWIALASRSVK